MNSSRLAESSLQPGTGSAAAWLRVARAAMLALIFVELLWEWRVAPLRPGGSWLVLKIVPLVAGFVVAGRGTVRARFATALLVLLYFIEGIVRAFSEHGRAALVAAAAAVLALLVFAALFAGARAARR